MFTKILWFLSHSYHKFPTIHVLKHCCHYRRQLKKGHFTLGRCWPCRILTRSDKWSWVAQKRTSHSLSSNIGTGYSQIMLKTFAPTNPISMCTSKKVDFLFIDPSWITQNLNIRFKIKLWIALNNEYKTLVNFFIF